MMSFLSHSQFIKNNKKEKSHFYIKNIIYKQISQDIHLKISLVTENQLCVSFFSNKFDVFSDSLEALNFLQLSTLFWGEIWSKSLLVHFLTPCLAVGLLRIFENNFRDNRRLLSGVRSLKLRGLGFCSTAVLEGCLAFNNFSNNSLFASSNKKGKNKSKI